MADLLAAGSLLLTVVTILYSIWYPEIVEALKRRIDQNPANRKKDYGECRAVLVRKTIPLASAASALFAISVPDVVKIIRYAFSQVGEKEPASYSAVNTTYVLVTLILGFLALHTISASITLAKHVHRMNPASG